MVASVTIGAGQCANLTGGLTSQAGTFRSTPQRLIVSLGDGSPAGDYDARRGSDRNLDAQYERSSHGCRRHADAHPQRRWYGHLCRRLRHQRALLRLYGGGRAEHLRPPGDAVNLNGATIADAAGNAANTGCRPDPNGPQIDTATPTVIIGGGVPSNGNLSAGSAVTLTLNLSEAVTVAGGTPTLTLNDGGTATYSGGSGTNALTFSYTVGAGQNTSALAATAVNLNSATIKDSGGNAANLSLSGLTQTGPQIDTTTPTITSVTESPASGDFNAGKRRDADAQHERGGDGCRRHADADAQRRRHRHLCQRLGQQRTELQLHGRGRTEHRSRLLGTAVNLNGAPSMIPAAMPQICR